MGNQICHSAQQKSNINNNNWLSMVSNFVGAQSTYKDIRIYIYMLIWSQTQMDATHTHTCMHTRTHMHAHTHTHTHTHAHTTTTATTTKHPKMELKLIKVQIEKLFLYCQINYTALQWQDLKSCSYINYEVSSRIDKGWVRALGDGLSKCYVPHEYL